MFTYVSNVLNGIEKQALTLSGEEIQSKMRRLCLDEFAEVLLNMPNSQYPNISSCLPEMASDEVQNNWTGSCGYTLLHQSLTFVRATWHSYERMTGRKLDTAKILDYGCGYGRLLRLMMYFANNDHLFGCDPWEKSIELCRESGIKCDLQVTDYLPLALPYPNGNFDLIYAFSVFTHTSLRATTTALAALSKIIRPDGVLVITIRPVEYWDYHQNLSDTERKSLKNNHDHTGFSFRPHNRQSVDGDITYGDTSISLEFIEKNFSDWKILDSERTLDDPYQRIVYLQHRRKES